jgi:ethanolamine ammonia-lyase small subunit
MQQDTWQFLQSFTPARIARGRAGHSLSTNELLKFQVDHAQARDAVYSILNVQEITASIGKSLELQIIHLKSEVNNRSQYLQRPDLGRTLSQSSREELMSVSHLESDICFVIADGLSAQAVNQNALPVLEKLIPKLKAINWKIAPICIVEQGRVAIADEIGFLLKSEIVVILIGERPGLSSPNSMGVYVTFHPHAGMTDESRNCVSNIRPEGMDFKEAVEKMLYLLIEMKSKKLSGVNLKDEYDASTLLNPVNKVEVVS